MNAKIEVEEHRITKWKESIQESCGEMDILTQDELELSKLFKEKISLSYFVIILTISYIIE